MSRVLVEQNPARTAGWLGGVPGFVSALWLALFLLWFTLTPLSNNREIDRLSLGLVAPELISGVLMPEPRPQGPGWHQLADRVDLMAVALLAWCCAWGWGRAARRWLSVPMGDGGVEQLVLEAGLGLAWLSVLTLGCGWCGVMSRPVVLGASLLGWGLAVWPQRRGEPASQPALTSGVVGRRRGSWWVTGPIVLGPFVLVITLGALLPSYDFDVNEYHFQGPREYLQAGRIHWLPHNVYTSFPFATEMLSLWSMIVRNDWYRGAVAGKLVLALYGVLTAGAIGAVTRRLFGSTAGVFAGLIWITSPWTCRISTIAYTEGALCFHVAASLLALVIWRQTRAAIPPHIVADSTARLDTRCLLWLGALAGGAMACKYPGLVSVVLPSAVAVSVFAWRDCRSLSTSPSGRSPSVKGFLQLIVGLWPWAVGVALFIGPWLLKNLVETGNPIYPLGWTIFGGADWDAELNAKWRQAHSSTDFSPASVVALVLEMAGRSDWQTPWLFALAPLSLWPRATRRLVGWLWLLMGWEFFTVWGLTHRLDRFWVPLMPVVAVLAGAGGAWLWDEVGNWGSGRSARMALRALAVLVWLMNFTFAVSPLGGYNGFLESFDAASRFVAEFTAPELVHLNQQLPPGSRVLVIGDAEMFEARFPVVYNTVFDHSIFEEWLGGEAAVGEDGFPDHAGRPLKSADEIQRILAERGITHFYVNWLEILRYRSPGNYGYTPFVSPARFDRLRELGLLGEPWRIETAVFPLDELDPGRREILRGWGDQPTMTRLGQRFLKTFEVFPVRRE